MNARISAAVVAFTFIIFAGCSGTPQPNLAPGSALPGPGLRSHAFQSAIRHIVIVIQENRSVDNLFQFLPGANTQSYGLASNGRRIQLQPQSLTAPYDLGHAHDAWVSEYAGGAMNGFNKEKCIGKCAADAAYGYVPQDQVGPYYSLAETYAFGDEVFESNQGPSFPAHQYLVSGTSTITERSANKASGNVRPIGNELGGCDSPPRSLVDVITAKGTEPRAKQTFPCFQRQSVMNEMDAAGVTWKYYQAKPGAGVWNAVDAIYSIWSNPAEMAANVITPPSQVLTDIAKGRLADVVWITPTSAASDHPQTNDGSGPSWVGSIVNAIGTSHYWSDTAIFITWDDWGGWYDHVTPTIYNSYELGFRVPLIVVSPYAKSNYVSHVHYEFGSILKFTEEIFGLPSLGTTDVRAKDVSDFFDFSQRPLKFKHIRTKYAARHFFSRSATKPDD